MPNLQLPARMRFSSTPEDMRAGALAYRMYRSGERGPYIYPRSPYALGDLVPGDMPTRFGPLKVFPDASQILAASTLSTVTQDKALPQSLGQETGRYDMAQRPFASCADAVPTPQSASPTQQKSPLTPQTFSTPMPSILRPRVLQTTDGGPSSIACWVADHPFLSVGAAVLVFAILKGDRK